MTIKENKRLLSALLAFAISLSATHGQDTDLPVLNSVRKSYEEQMQTEAVKPFEAGVSALNSKYSGALDRAQELAQQGGKLDEALMIKSEKEEIASGKGIPPQNDPKTPYSLKQLRETYRTTLAKLEQERDRKAKPLHEAYLRSLNGLVATLTKEGKLDDAVVVKKVSDDFAAILTIANQKEIDALRSTPISVPSAIGGTGGDKVIIWNTNNGGKGDRGTKKINLIFSSGGRETWRMNGLLLKWDANKQMNDEIKVPSVAVDKIRVEIKETVNNRGGLSEIEFIKNGQNISQGHAVDVSAVWEKDNKHDGSKLTDGDNTSDWLIPDKGLGWAEIHLTDKK